MSEDSKRPTGVDARLQRLFDTAFRGHRIHALPPKGGTRVWDAPPDNTQWIEAARTWMGRQKDCKFYFSPATIKPGSKTTTKADMLSSEWVWADLDPRDGQPLDAERAEILFLLTIDLPIDVARPTFIVDSGRGYWAFWRLEAPHIFDGRDGDATRAFEAVLSGLANSFGKFGDRSVKNINRIARLPSSVNPKTNVVAKVIEYNDARFALRDFPAIAIERKARADSADDAVPLDVFKRMLAATPYTGGPAGLDDRNTDEGWLQFAMAAHEAARGDSADYLYAFIEWCQNDPNGRDSWSAESIQARWESFDCDEAGGITRASWYRLLLFFGQDDLVSDASQDTTAAEDFADSDEADFMLPPPKSKAEAKARAKAQKDAAERERIRVAKKRNAIIRKVSAMLDKTVENGCTEEEAASALAKATDLIEEYKLTAEELTADLPPEEDDAGKRSDVGGDFTDIPTGSSPKDFYCHLPTNTFIYRPTHDMWPPSTINGRFGRGAANKLQRNRGVEQATWAPGFPPLIRDKLIANGAWVSELGTSCFNLYRPPLPNKNGDKDKVGPWLDHLKKVFPDDWEHIRNWFAYRVQRPEVKINHCVVMGGGPGTGKDTLIAGVREAIGAWNFQECNPPQLFEAFDASFLQSVILRINEARDLGESKVDRYQFYERTKTLMASPPETLTVQEKYLKRYSIMNLVCIIITTNNKTNGLYLKSDDRRHFVAWSPLTEADFEAGYFTKLWDWYTKEDGFAHVAAYLQEVDVETFDPKASPPKTNAFWEIVGANQAPEDGELSSLLTLIGDPFEQPDAVTVEQVAAMAWRHLTDFSDFHSMITDKKSRRTMPGRFERAGYVSVRNPGDRKDGLWAVNRKRQVIYVRKGLSINAQYAAAEALIKEAGRAAKLMATKRAVRPADEVDDLADLM
jgi:Family of unknown function (DUF5906)/Protein of unknown function (DUF2786)/Primase C terminal 2 (PriCT-2)